MDLTYQEVLADVYDENAKLEYVLPEEYGEDHVIEQYQRHDYEANELPNQEDFNKPFGDRANPDDLIIPHDIIDGIGLASIKKDNIFRMSVLNIDGQFRSNQIPIKNVEQSCGAIAQYTEPVQSGSNFRVRPARQYKNVYSVEVTSVEFPNSFYTFTKTRKNTSFTLTLATSYSIVIPDGNYSKMVNDITETPFLPPSPVGTPASTVTLDGTPITDKVITNDIGASMYGINNAGSHGLHDPMSSTDYTSTTGAPLPHPDTTTFLGIIQDEIDRALNGNNYSPVNGPVGLRYVVVGYSNSTNQVFFTCNDPTVNFSIVFPSGTNNSYGNGIGYNLGYELVTETSSLQTLPGEHSNPNLRFSCIIAPTFPDPIQDYYVFLKLSDWDLIEQEGPNQTMLSYFMKIPLSAPKFSVQFDNDVTNTTCKEYYFQQPTNISLIDITVLDAYGVVVDLLFDTLSLTLQIKEVMNTATYEALLKY